MPVQGICHAFQFVQSMCFFVLANIALFTICQTNCRIILLFRYLAKAVQHCEMQISGMVAPRTGTF